jgi:ketosteroid isomerase-like protein
MAVKEKAGDVVMRAKRRIGIENPSAADDSGNVGIVRGALRAFGEGNTDEFLDVLREDVTWEGPGGDFPGGESLSGRDEVREQFVDNVGRTFTEFGFVPESFLDADDDNAVVVFGRFVGEGAEGAGLDVPAVQVWAFKGSEADLVRIYTDSAEFPEVITEEKQKKREEEEKKKKEEAEAEEKKEEAEAEADSEGESDDDSESKSEESSESKSDDDSESKSEDDSDSEKSS